MRWFWIVCCLIPSVSWAQMRVSVTVLDSQLGKPPMERLRVKLVIHNDSPKTRLFVVPEKVGQVLTETMTIDGREVLRFDAAQTVRWHRMRGEASFYVFTVRGKGSLRVSQLELQRWDDSKTVNVWMLDELRLGDDRVSRSEKLNRHLRIRDAQKRNSLRKQTFKPATTATLTVKKRKRARLRWRRGLAPRPPAGAR